MKLAIVGGGISGLTAAHRLAGRHDVTLIEANDYLGGHTNTVDVEWEGVRYAVDTGFIVFNHRTYPHFTQLLSELGIRSQPTSMSFSVRCQRTGFEYGGARLNGLFAQRRNLVSFRFYRFLWDLLRFNRRALSVLEEDESLTVGEYFSRERYSRAFIDYYFMPLGSAVWSCPTGTFARFPMRFIVEFYRNHGLLSITDQPTWQVIPGGSREYVAALRRRISAEIHTGLPVEHVVRYTDRVVVATAAWRREYDHVIFACHSDQALRILGAGATPREREILSAFPYERNVAILHTDESLLPHRRRAWASWNYLVAGDDAPHATVTYNMNRLQGLAAPVTFCVTLNGERWIDPARVLGTFSYAHPVFGRERAAAQRRHGEMIGQLRTSFCGAYWGNGFHEDGVASALAVCRAIDASVPSGSSSGRPQREVVRSSEAGAALVRQGQE